MEQGGQDAAVVLANEVLQVTVDPGYGGEIRSLLHRPSGTEMFMHSPWREAALMHRRPGFSFDPDRSALEWWARYGGGLQMIFPHAGVSEERDGLAHPFHGEACAQAWTVMATDATSVTMETQLITAPIRARRTIRLDGSTLCIRDTLHNRAERPVPYMFIYHPAFGAPFLDPGCEIATSAARFHYDPIWLPDRAALGASPPWPGAQSEGGDLRLDRAPARGAGEFVFGWLEDLGPHPWYEIRNPALKLGVRASWQSPVLSHAWMLRDSGGSQGFPWHGESYCFAIEPATCATGGEGQQPRILPPSGQEAFDFDINLFEI